MWTSWHDRLHQTLRHRQLLQKQQRLLLAVSGGQDSLALARLMLDLQPKWGWQLAIAHCNHRWRTDAEDNARHVQMLAETWKLPCWQVIAETTLASEAAARDWRYAQLTAIAQSHGCAIVLTGHTASDRAETLLYNLFRGSGTDGLQSLTWQRPLAAGVQLLRPLLQFTRAETAQICTDLGLSVWEDTTNQNLNHARNRIRQELLPYLKTHFNPQIELTLSQTAELLQADVDFLETATAEKYPPGVGGAAAGDGTARIHRPTLVGLAIALQRRALRQFLKTSLPVAPTFQDIEKLRALLHAPNRSQSDPFAGGAIAVVEGEWIRLSQGSCNF